MPKFSRRGFSALLLAPLFRLRGQSTPAAPTSAPPPVPRDGASSRIASRTYRADALITLLGVTIFRRAGVGGGQASMEETGEGGSLRRRSSSPQVWTQARPRVEPPRLDSRSRVGTSSSPSESTYFGVLTSSPEESLEHARKAVVDPPSGRAVFSAVNGRNTAGHSRSAVTHFDFPAAAIWSDRALIEHAQSTFHENVVWRETSWPKSPDQTPPTFLLLLATLLKQRTRRSAGRYVYNEQEYLLELDAQQPGRDRLHPSTAKSATCARVTKPSSASGWRRLPTPSCRSASSIRRALFCASPWKPCLPDHLASLAATSGMAISATVWCASGARRSVAPGP